MYDCVGTGTSLADAMKFTRPRGTVVALGTSQISVVDTTPLWFKELTVMGAYGRQMEAADGAEPQHTYRMTFDLITSGRLKVDGLQAAGFLAERIPPGSSGRCLGRQH